MTPLVSVIIPCYNQGHFLSETLESVLHQTYNNWECLIVNDGSSDMTHEIASKFVQKDKRFHYIYQENSGVSVARNCGIRHSTGEFLLPLDADDLIDSTYMEKAMRYFEIYPKTKLVYSKADMFGKVNQDWNLKEYKYNEFIWNNCIFNAAFFRRSDYDEIKGGYNEGMVMGFEDWEFFLSLLDESSIVHRMDETLFHYRIHSVSRNRNVEEDPYDTLVMMANLHPEIYQKFWNQTLALKKLVGKESYYRNSLAYKLGMIILKPYRIIKKIFKQC